MNFFENLINKIESAVNPEQHKFDVIQGAQITLIGRAGGDEVAGTWIDANSTQFRQLMEDTRFNYLERLDDEDTYDATIEEIEGKLTTLNTIH